LEAVVDRKPGGDSSKVKHFNATIERSDWWRHQAPACFECGGRLSWPGLREAKFQTWRDPRDRADKHQRFD
jgi:hypothetical protein